MSSNRFEGAARDIRGKVQEAAGEFLGDAQDQLNRAAGKAQDVYGQAAGQVKSMTREQPIGALVTAMGLGLFVGYILSRR